MMMWGLGTNIIMGLLTAVLLSVLITEVYAQTTTTTTPPTTTIPGGEGGNTTTSSSLEEEQAQAANFTNRLVNLTISERMQNNTEVQALRTQDPQFKSFTDIWVNCVNNSAYGNGTISEFQCQMTLDEATNRWCGIDAYDPKKCEHATNMVSGYHMVNQLLAVV